MEIGTYKLKNNLVLAPMAGVTDSPFRKLCRGLGASMAISEMVTANPLLWKSKKTQNRTNHCGEDSPRAVQIVGADPEMMAAAAQFNVDHGAEIIDINMGCPAKKVCNVLAGSALLKDEKLVARILSSVVQAVNVPVTLKIRTGWDLQNRNGRTIARIAEESGVQALTVHGRTRACGFNGKAEHDTVREIKSQVKIPVIANGDIKTAQEAHHVLTQTGADGIMIGRAAQGNPWIFREIDHYLTTGSLLVPPTSAEIYSMLMIHLQRLYSFYGEYTGVRIARKHIGWYCKHRINVKHFLVLINQVETANEQLNIVERYFDGGIKQGLAA